VDFKYQVVSHLKFQKMKSATDGQFREVISKLLTGVDHEKIVFDRIQQFIAYPKQLTQLFVDFINQGTNQIGGISIVNEKRVYEHRVTSLQVGDELTFDTNNEDVSLHRPSLCSEKVVFNRTGDLDDLIKVGLKEVIEITRTCNFLAKFIKDCKGVEQVTTPQGWPELVRIKFI